MTTNADRQSRSIDNNVLTSLPFFASAAEQLKWLRGVLSTSGLWCVSDIRFQAEARELPERAVLELLSTQSDGALRVFMGRVDLCKRPVWRETPRGRELDVIRSRAIQLVPSYVVHDALIEGRIDILRKAEYDLADLEFSPLSRWFAELADSLKLALNAKPIVVGTRSSTGEVVRSPGKVILSQEALEWRKGGGHLKQMPESLIEIDIMNTL